MLSGVCVYACINHLSIALRRPLSFMHLSFACLCLAVVLAIMGRVAAYQAHSIDAFVSAMRWNLAFVTIVMMIFPWVIADFTRIRPLAFLDGMTIVFVVMFVWNLYARYSLQYEHITALSHLRLPWGEVLTTPVGQRNPIFPFMILAILTEFAYFLYALRKAWQRDHSRPTLIMLVTIGVFLLTVIEGLAVRFNLIHFIQLGWVGFLILLISMSFILSHNTQQRLRDSERRFRSLLEQSPFSIQVFSPDGYSCQVNPAWQQLWKGGPYANSPSYNILHDAQLVSNGAMPYIAKGFAGRATDIPPIIYKLPRGPELTEAEADHWLRGYIYPIKGRSGSIRDVILMHEDVTDKKRIEDTVRLIAAGVSSAIGEQFFEQLVLNLAKVFKADSAFIAMQDKHDWFKLNMLSACSNGQITNAVAFSLACVPLMRILNEGTCIYPHDVQQQFPEECLLTDSGVQALIGTAIQVNEKERGLLVVMHNEPIEHVEQASEILDIFAVRAGAELQRLHDEEHIRHLAYQDDLTGLPNRAQLHERLGKIQDPSRPGNREGALLLIDLDHFKTINDALGHNVGDELLLSVAHRLSESCDKNVFLARFGGDEFVALFEKDSHMDRDTFQHIINNQAQHIQTQLSRPISTGDRIFSLGVSIGIVQFQGDAESDLDILRHADMALHHAKSKGRGIIQLYMPELEIAATKRLQIEAGLRAAIDNQELELYYQPLVNTAGNAVAAEVLLRWHHPRLGEVAPTSFIPVAEETGLIHGIGSWVFEQACAHLTQWKRNGTPFHGHIAINVSPWQFARPDFVSDIRRVLQQYDVAPQQFMLELTETAFLYDIKETIEKLQDLRQLGLRIALDDFGTGYSSLAYLRDLPLDQLKIDKHFVNDIASTSEQPLVESMIDIGRHMKLTVVAEGVETEAQRDKLIELGCEYFQGFLFCRPIPKQDFLAWVDSHPVRD